jgi:hypothetical protein
MPRAENAGGDKNPGRFNKKDLIWWISPILILLVLLAVFLVVVEGSSLAPLVYEMF